MIVNDTKEEGTHEEEHAPQPAPQPRIVRNLEDDRKTLSITNRLPHPEQITMKASKSMGALHAGSCKRAEKMQLEREWINYDLPPDTVLPFNKENRFRGTLERTPACQVGPEYLSQFNTYQGTMNKNHVTAIGKAPTGRFKREKQTVGFNYNIPRVFGSNQKGAKIGREKRFVTQPNKLARNHPGCRWRPRTFAQTTDGAMRTNTTGVFGTAAQRTRRYDTNGPGPAKYNITKCELATKDNAFGAQRWEEAPRQHKGFDPDTRLGYYQGPAEYKKVGWAWGPKQPAFRSTQLSSHYTHRNMKHVQGTMARQERFKILS